MSRFFLQSKYLLLSSGLISLTLGCGPREPARVAVYKTSGKIVLEDQPLANAMIVLQPKSGAVAARATSDQNGDFALSTYDAGDGAAAGDYDVTVTYYEAIKTKDGIVPGPNVLDEKFSLPGQSGLKATVVAGNVNDIGTLTVSR